MSARAGAGGRGAATWTAAELAAAWQADGWRPGRPAHLLDVTERIDRGVCRRTKCPSCGRRGMAYHAYHLGTAYRVLCECPRCGAGEQM